MSSNSRNRQLGPYELGAKYKDTGDMGRLYRARRTGTGAPALVLEPSKRHPEDTPLATWRLRLSSSVAPAYVALEVESAPEDASAREAGEELDYMLDDLHAAVTHVLERPETLRHLRARPKPAGTRRDWRPHAVGAALAAGIALVMVHGGGPVAPSPRPVEAALAPSAFDAGLDDMTVAAFTDTTDVGPVVLARPMPERPFKAQKRPPCKKTIEEEHFGGCWVPHESRAPCDDELYELDGRCFVPVVKSPPPPASISR